MNEEKDELEVNKKNREDFENLISENVFIDFTNGNLRLINGN